MAYSKSTTQDIEEQKSAIKLAEDIIDKICEADTINAHLADDIHQQQETYIDEKHLRYRFNVISAAARGKLRETAHSLILSYILYHPDLQKSFVRHFLGKESPQYMKVDTEYGDAHSHIDIILHTAKECIIVENKANNAQEQPQQVYRYVKEIAEQQLKIQRKNIYVLYLNPTSHTPPSSQSVTDSDGKDNLIQSLKDRFIVKSFAYDIPQWLDKIINDFDNEPIIKSGIQQYLDYLQNYFYTSEIYNDMNKEIQQNILEAYNINDTIPLKEQIDILTGKKENIANLANQLDQIINSKKEEYTRQRMSEIFDLMKTDFKDLKDVEFYDNLIDKPLINIGLGYNVNDMQINFHIEYNCISTSLYYGIICSQKDYPEAYDIISKKFGPYFENLPVPYAKPDANWPMWRFSSIEDVYSHFKKLIKFSSKLN